MTPHDTHIAVTNDRVLHIDVKQIHHSFFPEVRAQAESSLAAARLLLTKLANVRDTAITDTERDTIDRAMVEVEQFAGRCGRVLSSARKAVSRSRR